MKVRPGETWFVEFGKSEKPRWAYVLSAREDGGLALATVAVITTQFGDTPYEISLPRVPWLREQSYINAQSIQPVKLAELTRKAPGQFDRSVFEWLKAAVKHWLDL